MNKWFKNFPYPGWAAMIIAALIAAVATYQFEKKRYEPEKLTASVQADFSNREKSMLQDTGIRKPLPGTADLYSTFLVDQGKAIAWHAVTVDLPQDILQHPHDYIQGRLIVLPNGYYYTKAFPVQAGCYRIFLIPVAYEYPIDNAYFHSGFVADKRIPVTTQIDTVAQPGAYTVLDHNQKPVCYLYYTQTADELYTAGPWVWVFSIGLMLCVLFWIHGFCYGIGLRTGKPLLGWLILVFFLTLPALVRNNFRYPVGFLNSKLFSPELFSSVGIRSLGDFLLMVIALFWCLFYLMLYVPLSEVRMYRKRTVDIVIRLILSCALNWVIFHKVTALIRKLILDSKISFEAGNFYGLDQYTFLGIVCLCIITIDFLLLLAIINKLLMPFLPRKIYRYSVFLLICALSFGLHADSGMWNFDVVIIIMSVAGLLMIDAFGMPLQRKRERSDLSAPGAGYIWFAILCAWITLEIFYFNYSKERELRKVFAVKQEQQDDGLIEYDFATIAVDMQQDTTIAAFFRKNIPDTRNQVCQYIIHNYLSAYLEKYTPGIYFYDRRHQPLSDMDTVSMALSRVADSIRGGVFVPGLSNVSHTRKGTHLYWFLNAITDDKDTLGYIGIDLAAVKTPEVNKRSFLEQKHNPTDQQYYDNYSLAIYRNDTLWSQGGSEIFPYRHHRTDSKEEFRFEAEGWLSSTLWFRASDAEWVKVVYKRNLAVNIISIFSYVLGVLLLLVALTFLARQLFFYPGKMKFFFKNFNFTIRSKINLTILVTVLASLLVVGVITLYFLNNKYQESRHKNLQRLLVYYTQSILRFSEDQHYHFDALPPGTSSAYSDLSYKLNAMAVEQGSDINLYNRNGKLIATSQLQLFKKGLLSQYLQWEVYQSLSRGDQSELVKEDKIGDLEYQSAYSLIRDKDDNILAYINLPYYASGPERASEISNVLVILINVYTLVFFISGICAIFISNGIVRSFRLLIEQFRNIRLRHNEFIIWPYKDEIGLLVKEYNAMMKKVEAMASRLARNEREEAWREIAKQVAHEIKNPLTPMKLNIQYLQQAIQHGRPDIEKLASRVSETLIEQIEHLNLIATEFSGFAKMPESNPEPLNIARNLQSLVALFQKDSQVKVELVGGDENIAVMMDKGYFIRVFTNLIKNAIQAVGDKPGGEVSISYEQNEDNVVMKVKDNGTGIPADLQEKLFLPYFTTKSSGTGLGLSMTKNMVEHSNGMVWFHTAEHEGSEFYVQLPVYVKNAVDDR